MLMLSCCIVGLLHMTSRVLDKHHMRTTLCGICARISRTALVCRHRRLLVARNHGAGKALFWRNHGSRYRLLSASVCVAHVLTGTIPVMATRNRAVEPLHLHVAGDAMRHAVHCRSVVHVHVSNGSCNVCIRRRHSGTVAARAALLQHAPKALVEFFQAMHAVVLERDAAAALMSESCAELAARCQALAVVLPRRIAWWSFLRRRGRVYGM
jgi:hypothetical protein